MRVCLIWKCSSTGDRRCCADCDRVCPSRCMNHPDRCKCWGNETPTQQHRRKDSIDPAKILELAQQGLTYKEIAAQVGRKPGTVQWHLGRMGYYRRERREDE